ncbi:putative bifunctional diguanylate cyclase/phosphodiesterase [Aquimixticola soesokkakensis]|uniref:putative bifunctional diguanylate cyclase/phosphodiesterase n=1 Tax=Aquimixticola soesokkakensis TaxID=1519096 RepID=UPI0013563DCB|nr:GGDEF and EAL domain-containing protein [Aquimixticola soesokkakensis]
MGRASDALTLYMCSFAQGGVSHDGSDDTSVVEHQMGRVRAAQVRAVFGIAPLVMLSTAVNIGTFVATRMIVGDVTALDGVWAAVGLWVSGVFLVRMMRKRRQAFRSVSSARGTGVIVLHSACVALIWTYPLLAVVQSQSPGEVMFTGILITGLMSAGAIALYPVPLAAVTFVFIIALVALPFVFLSFGALTVPALIICVVFLVLVATAIRRHSQHFLSELVGKLQAEHQRDMINLLIGTYHSEDGAHCLWQADANLDLGQASALAARTLGMSHYRGGSRLSDLMRGAHLHAYRAADTALVQALGDPQGAWPAQFSLLVETDGDLTGRRVFELAARKATLADDTPLSFNGYIRDRTAEVVADEVVERLASRDALTGLLNYVAFKRQAREKMASGPLLLVFVDADNLKMVNDTFGHAAGDAAIRTLGIRLRRSFGGQALVCRKGGNEFLLLVDVVDLAQDLLQAEDLQSALNSPFAYAGHQIPLAATLGAVHEASGSLPIEEMVLRADRAQAQARTRGRGEFQLYDAEVGERVRRERVLARDIHAALDPSVASSPVAGELSLAFQPIVRAGDGSAAGAEALLRWTHPTLGAISPEKIVGAASSEGLGAALTDYVIAQACAEAAAWPAPVFLSVNVRPWDMSDPDFANRVLSACSRAGLSAARLWLEITEEEMMEETPYVMRNIQSLRAKGVRLAIDDFGAGYSAMGHFDRYPCDVVKIDRAVVQGCHERAVSRIVLDAVQAMAQASDVQVVAEGVEIAAEFDCASARGVDYFQGYFYHRPMTAAEFSALLARQAAPWVAPVSGRATGG